MDDAYQNAMRTVAEAYEAEVLSFGGRSLSRVSTIVASNGTFFERLRQGKPFYVHNLDRFAAWFRQPANWPMGSIPQSARDALLSIGRPACDVNTRHPETTSHVLPSAEVVEGGAPVVPGDRRAISQCIKS